MAYYLIITNKSDYMADIRNRFSCAGFPERNEKRVKKMKPGDKIVYYVTKESRFCAVVDVVGKYFLSYEKIWTDEYDLWEHRIKTKPVVYKKSYREGIYIKDIWDNLDMIANKGKWGSQVMGSFRELTDNDFDVIYKALKGEK